MKHLLLLCLSSCLLIGCSQSPIPTNQPVNKSQVLKSIAKSPMLELKSAKDLLDTLSPAAIDCVKNKESCGSLSELASLLPTKSNLLSKEIEIIQSSNKLEISGIVDSKISTINGAKITFHYSSMNVGNDKAVLQACSISNIETNEANKLNAINYSDCPIVI